ncbi:unnamed protein product, partial [Mesorhabditis belari]|uniref:Uncharacterized protein n=1 Tax=Mesorhabditis belari TaxID=2138241 RepID=A0AAF3FHS8_9BILA
MERVRRCDPYAIPVCEDIVERLEILQDLVDHKVKLSWSSCYQDFWMRSLVYANGDKLVPELEKNKLSLAQGLGPGPKNWKIENFVDADDLDALYDLKLKPTDDGVFLCLPIAILFPNRVLGIRDCRDWGDDATRADRHQTAKNQIQIAVKNQNVHQHMPAPWKKHGDVVVLKPLTETGDWIRVIILAHAGSEDREEEEWLVAPVDAYAIGEELTWKIHQHRLYVLPKDISLSALPCDLFTANLRGLDTLRFGMGPYVRMILDEYITKPLTLRQHRSVGIIDQEPEQDVNVDFLIMVDHENGIETPIIKFDSWHPFFLTNYHTMPRRPNIRELMRTIWDYGVIHQILPNYYVASDEDNGCNRFDCRNVDCFMIGRHNVPYPDVDVKL